MKHLTPINTLTVFFTCLQLATAEAVRDAPGNPAHSKSPSGGIQLGGGTQQPRLIRLGLDYKNVFWEDLRKVLSDRNINVDLEDLVRKVIESRRDDLVAELFRFRATSNGVVQALDQVTDTEYRDDLVLKIVQQADSIWFWPVKEGSFEMDVWDYDMVTPFVPTFQRRMPDGELLLVALRSQGARFETFRRLEQAIIESRKKGVQPSNSAGTPPFNPPVTPGPGQEVNPKRPAAELDFKTASIPELERFISTRGNEAAKREAVGRALESRRAELIEGLFGNPVTCALVPPAMAAIADENWRDDVALLLLGAESPFWPSDNPFEETGVWNYHKIAPFVPTIKRQMPHGELLLGALRTKESRDLTARMLDYMINIKPGYSPKNVPAPPPANR